MNKIKFRGISTGTGKWVYGGYCDGFIITDIGDDLVCYGDWIESRDVSSHQVEPSSVGQFTGLLDCAGKELFKNDIIETLIIVSRLGRPARSKIEWFEDKAKFQVDNPFINIFDAQSIKLIGNIFEHSDLLTNSE